MLATSRSPLPFIQITDTDMQRLQKSVDHHLNSSLASAAELLELELYRAQIVSPKEVPADVVTMRARVVYESLQTGKQREISLVYPEESDLFAGKVSVLTPLGTAILGLKVGDCVDWPLSNGRWLNLRILDVPYQPEAMGDFHL